MIRTENQSMTLLNDSSRRVARPKCFGKAKTLPQAEFTSAEDVKSAKGTRFDRMIKMGMVKLIRAQGECLGIRSR